MNNERITLLVYPDTPEGQFAPQKIRDLMPMEADKIESEIKAEHGDSLIVERKGMDV